MDAPEIKEIETLLSLEDGKKVVFQTVKRLTAPGENYGSLMLSVDIVVEDSDRKQEEIKAVAKMVPPNEFIQQMFNTEVTFRNEIAFYKTMVPILQNFQREHGIQNVIDFFPKFIGGRINLADDNDAKVDYDAVLLLENLKASNFVNIDRTEGFDLDAAKLIIKDLAYLHGVPLALKLQKPEVFEKEFKPYLAGLKPPPDDDEREMKMREKMRKAVESANGCKPFVQRVMKVINTNQGFGDKSPPREPFATISHNDVWVNNTMIKHDRGKPIKNKLVDFQVCTYASPAKDLLFFLFSSIKNHILEKHYESLVQLYHKTLIAILTELNCDISPFSFSALQKEIELELKQQFVHILFMLFPIFAARGTVNDITEIDEKDFMSDEPITDLHKEKLAFVIKEFVKRNWI